MRNIPASWWAFAYLLLIPISALIYYFLPRFYPNQAHFYHSSSQYEKAHYDDADSIIKQLREVLAQNFPGTGSEYTTQKNGWTIAVQGVRVRELQPGENTIRIEFMTWLEKSTSAMSKKTVSTSVTASIPIIGYASVAFPIYGDTDHWLDRGLVCKPLLFDRHEVTLFDQEILDLDAIFVSQPCVPPSLTIPVTVDQRLRVWWNAGRGFPTYSSGGFFRMFYFSAITITTIGYGDIYPISNIARFFVAVEAISGIVFAGLFFNAIVQKQRTRS